MKNFMKLLLLLPGLILNLWGQALTLEDIFQNGTYAHQTFSTQGWVDGGAGYLVLRSTPRGDELVRHDGTSGEESVLLSATELVLGGDQITTKLDPVILSPNQQWVLLGTGTVQLWRRSNRAITYLYNMATGSIRPLNGTDNYQQAASFSPDSRHVAYVMENNLYDLNLETFRTRQLTKDGNFRIINGHGDWVYEEEFSLTKAYEWSPDSRSIAFLRFHQWPGRESPKTYPLIDELLTYPKVLYLAYPKVGEDNSVMRLGVINVRKGKPKWIDLGPEKDIYIPRIYWTGRPNEVAFIRIDRRQQKLEIVLGDTKSGRSRVSASQTDPAWVDLTDDLYFIDGGDRFIWTDEKSGYRHIYLRNTDGDGETALTSGKWEVTDIIAVDEAGGQVWYNSKEDGSAENQVYLAAFDGSGSQRLTGPGGWHTVNPAPDFSYYLHSAGSINQPPSWALRSKDGSLVRWIIEKSLPEWDAMTLPKWELFDMTTTDGTLLRAKILRPPGFSARNKYPTIIYTYGGPGSQRVKDEWSESRGRDLYHRYLAQQGYVVLTVDGRGTGGRGKAFKNLAYGDLGRWSLHDQIEATRWIASESWGDPDRIGIWGWSGGGYLTGMAMTAGAEHFKMGISISPVTDFRLYDTIWTERYMGLLTDNGDGYAATNVLNHLDNYRGNWLVVHGTGDDNVHAQNTWQLINALIERNKEFDSQFYPNKNHNLPGVHFHLYSMMTRFIKERL